MPPIGALLVNIGSPDSPTPAAVRRYLKEFLSDPRVLDIHPVLRSLLVQWILLRRPHTTARQYASIWQPEGSPLCLNSDRLAQKVGAQLGPDYVVRTAMRSTWSPLTQPLKWCHSGSTLVW